jgi:hypothetical protein
LTWQDDSTKIEFDVPRRFPRDVTIRVGMADRMMRLSELATR